eukprot:365126-Chlamydomonas_euryale.AAC.50
MAQLRPPAAHRPCQSRATACASPAAWTAVAMARLRRRLLLSLQQQQQRWHLVWIEHGSLHCAAVYAVVHHCWPPLAFAQPHLCPLGLTLSQGQRFLAHCRARGAPTGWPTSRQRSSPGSGCWHSAAGWQLRGHGHLDRNRPAYHQRACQRLRHPAPGAAVGAWACAPVPALALALGLCLGLALGLGPALAVLVPQVPILCPPLQIRWMSCCLRPRLQHSRPLPAPPSRPPHPRPPPRPRYPRRRHRCCHCTHLTRPLSCPM